MNWKKWTFIIIILLFVVANFYLIFKKDSEVARLTYIKDWQAVKEQNLVLSKKKEGVVAPADEEHIYFQFGAGDFEQFLVKEGEEVVVGTPLFEYSPRDLEATIQQYEAEIPRLELERDAIQDNIDHLEMIKDDLSDEDVANKAVASTIDAQIYEKESQLARMDGEIGKFEDLISIANTTLGSLSVASTIKGVVKEISHDLQNPVVTITSTDQLAKGLLEEDELLEIEEGMKVIITLKTGKLEGTISKVAVNPEENPQVDKKSQYAFMVEFAEEGEGEEEESDVQVFPGAHVDLKIITKEVENALILPGKAIRGGNIYVLKTDGTVEKRPVETGIEVGKVVEITSEVEEGELVVSDPSNLKNKIAFFTPVEVSKIKKSNFQELGKKEMFRYLGRGLLSK